jgi:hypothetical protein
MENPHRVGNSVRETREKLLQIREDWKGKGMESRGTGKEKRD